MEGLLRKEAEALKPLFARYASLVFHIASQSLGPDGAEDIVQDVFLSVWRKADTLDPRRGSFRPWLLQIVHHRILNELRARSRRPRVDPDSDARLERLPDSNGEPAHLVWQAYRQDPNPRVMFQKSYRTLLRSSHAIIPILYSLYWIRFTGKPVSSVFENTLEFLGEDLGRRQSGAPWTACRPPSGRR